MEVEFKLCNRTSQAERPDGRLGMRWSGGRQGQAASCSKEGHLCSTSPEVALTGEALGEPRFRTHWDSLSHQTWDTGNPYASE